MDAIPEFKSPEDFLLYFLKRALEVSKEKSKSIKIKKSAGAIYFDDLCGFVEKMASGEKAASFLCRTCEFLRTSIKDSDKNYTEIDVMVIAILNAAAAGNLNIKLDKLGEGATARGDRYDGYNAATYELNYNFRTKEADSIIKEALNELKISDFQKAAREIIEEEFPGVICNDLFKEYTGVVWNLIKNFKEENAVAFDFGLKNLERSIKSTFEGWVYGEKFKEKNFIRSDSDAHFNLIDFNKFSTSLAGKIKEKLDLENESVLLNTLFSKLTEILTSQYFMRPNAVVAPEPVSVNQLRHLIFCPEDTLNQNTLIKGIEKVPREISALLRLLVGKDKKVSAEGVNDHLFFLSVLAKFYVGGVVGSGDELFGTNQTEDAKRLEELVPLFISEIGDSIEKMDALNFGYGALYVHKETPVEAFVTIINCFLKALLDDFNKNPAKLSSNFLENKYFRENMLRNTWFFIRLFKPVLEGSAGEKLKKYDIDRFANILLLANWYLPDAVTWESYSQKLRNFLEIEIAMSQNVVDEIFAKVDEFKHVLDAMQRSGFGAKFVAAVNMSSADVAHLIKTALSLSKKEKDDVVWTLTIDKKSCEISPAVMTGFLAFFVLLNRKCSLGITGDLFKKTYAAICEATVELMMKTDIAPDVSGLRQLKALLPIIQIANPELAERARKFLEKHDMNQFVKDAMTQMREKILKECFDFFPKGLLEGRLRKFLKESGSDSATGRVELATLFIEALKNAPVFRNSNNFSSDKDAPKMIVGCEKVIQTMVKGSFPEKGIEGSKKINLGAKDAEIFLNIWMYEAVVEENEKRRSLGAVSLLDKVFLKKAKEERAAFGLWLLESGRPALLLEDKKKTSSDTKIVKRLEGGSAVAEGVFQLPKVLTGVSEKSTEASSDNKQKKNNEKKIIAFSSSVIGSAHGAKIFSRNGSQPF